MMTTLLILKLTFLLRKSIKKYSFIQEKKKYCSIPNFLTDMQSTLYTFEWGHLAWALHILHTTFLQIPIFSKFQTAQNGKYKHTTIVYSPVCGGRGGVIALLPPFHSMKICLSNMSEENV